MEKGFVRLLAASDEKHGTAISSSFTAGFVPFNAKFTHRVRPDYAGEVMIIFRRHFV